MMMSENRGKSSGALRLVLCLLFLASANSIWVTHKNGEGNSKVKEIKIESNCMLNIETADCGEVKKETRKKLALVCSGEGVCKVPHRMRLQRKYPNKVFVDRGAKRDSVTLPVGEMLGKNATITNQTFAVLSLPKGSYLVVPLNTQGAVADLTPKDIVENPTAPISAHLGGKKFVFEVGSDGMLTRRPNDNGAVQYKEDVNYEMDGHIFFGANEYVTLAEYSDGVWEALDMQYYSSQVVFKASNYEWRMPQADRAIMLVKKGVQKTYFRTIAKTDLTDLKVIGPQELYLVPGCLLSVDADGRVTCEKTKKLPKGVRKLECTKKGCVPNTNLSRKTRFANVFRRNFSKNHFRVYWHAENTEHGMEFKISDDKKSIVIWKPKPEDPQTLKPIGSVFLSSSAEFTLTSGPSESDQIQTTLPMEFPFLPTAYSVVAKSNMPLPAVLTSAEPSGPLLKFTEKPDDTFRWGEQKLQTIKCIVQYEEADFATENMNELTREIEDEMNALAEEVKRKFYSEPENEEVKQKVDDERRR